MALTEQVKILDDKIKAKKAQYDLDREAAKVSALSSGELEKYEYLAGEDLGYKPDLVQKAKFEYSSLGKAFNTRLDESDKKEGVLRRLENTEGKNKDQLDAIKEHGKKQLDAIKYQRKKQLDAIEKQKIDRPKIIEKDKIVSLENRIDELFEMYPKSFTSQGKKLLKTLTKSENRIDYKNLSCKLLFSDIINFLKKYDTLFSLLESLVTRKMSVDSANADQISYIINSMHGYSDEKYYDTEKVKSEFFHNTTLTKAKKKF